MIIIMMMMMMIVTILNYEVNGWVGWHNPKRLWLFLAELPLTASGRGS